MKKLTTIDYAYQPIAKRKNRSPFFRLMFFLLALSGYCLSINAQAPPSCGNLGCNSQDVKIIGAKIADVNGNFFTCSGNDPVNGAYLHLTVQTNTSRIGVYISAQLVVAGQSPYHVSNCFSDSLNGTRTLKVQLPDGFFNCGESATLEQIFTAWGTGTSDFCMGSPAERCPATKSKCRFVTGEVIIVQTTPCTQPVITSSPSAISKCVGASTTFTAKFMVGSSPITTSYKWQTCNGTCAINADWSDITIAGIYSETNSLSGSERTTNLTISAAGMTSALNNNKYRVFVSNISSQEPDKPPCTLGSSAALLTVVEAPTASAGGSQTICQGGTATVSGASSSNGTINWTENGAGSITAGQGSLTPTYTSAAGDAGNTVTLTMTVSNSPCTSAAATYSVVVKAQPTASAGGSQTICQGGTATVSGAASSNGTINWTENGAGSITAGQGSLTPTYTSAAGDAGNTVTLTMTVSNSPCTAATATYSVVVKAQPTASAGGSQTICANATATVSGASSSNGTINWTENGAGTITAGQGTLTPTYTSAAGDAGNTVTLTMTVSNSPCTAATATFAVIVGAIPTLPVFTITEPSICGSSTASINFCSTISGFTYQVGGQTLNGNGIAQFISGLAAGSGPGIVVTNTTGGCQTTFTCSQRVATCPAARTISNPTNETSAKSAVKDLLVEDKMGVKAFPNPFNDKVKFIVTVPQAGQGTLELMNIQGQKIKTIFSGEFVKGGQQFEMELPALRNSTLIYVFKIGGKQITGKLVQLGQ